MANGLPNERDPRITIFLPLGMDRENAEDLQSHLDAFIQPWRREFETKSDQFVIDSEDLPPPTLDATDAREDAAIRRAEDVWDEGGRR